MFPIISDTGNCRDCYRCLRTCAVKAISFRTGQAKILTDQCVLCGKCVKECPQYTKTVIDQLPKLKTFLEKEKVVLSLPPTFVNHFSQWTQKELWARLKYIGFYAIEEMSVNAEPFLDAYANLLQNSDDYIISSHCPIVVNLIEKHHPKLLPHLAPIENEAVIHARLLKQQYGDDVKVVHISPCLSMIDNSEIDLTLTFDQALDFIFSYKITPEELDKIEVSLTEYKPIGAHLALAGNLMNIMIQRNVVSSHSAQYLSGLKTCMEALEELEKNEFYGSKFIELAGCRNGCVNGFGLERKGILQKKIQVNNYYNTYCNKPVRHFGEIPDVTRSFTDRYQEPIKVETSQIREILSHLKMYNKKVMNCGACGYDSCYEKAVAVAQGKAEETMCITYMRNRAESTANTVFRSNPSAIIIFDNDFIIHEFNPAAREMFAPYKIKEGNAVFEFIDHRDFEKVVETGRGIKDHIVHYDDINLVTRQNIIRMQGAQTLYMAIITDITEESHRRDELEKMKEETLEKATQVINNQMFVAQQIAGLLGETTAETKVTLLDLITQFNREKELE